MLPDRDFPQIWQKPAFEELMTCLGSLRVEPRAWNVKLTDPKAGSIRDTTGQLRREEAAYLSGVIKSSLAWIKDEDQREEIWTEASKRLSERCGRTAMGELVRSWSFEGRVGREDQARFDLVIREPALTGDSLGLKTWGSSYVLAQMLDEFSASALSHLLSGNEDRPAVSVLELGSGTGLLGLAAAAIWRTEVVLSDLPAIMPNLVSNGERNQATIQSRGGRIRTGALTWGGSADETDQTLFGQKNQFKMVLAADPLYDDDHPELLAGTIHDQLSLGPEPRALVMVPRRDDTTVALLSTFRSSMAQQRVPLTCVAEGAVTCRDDWGEGDESSQVECWWGLFARGQG